MNKQGKVVDSKFGAMFVSNFRERLTFRRLTESKGK